MLTLLLYLSLMSPEQQVYTLAGMYGVDPDYAACICRRESSFQPQIVGDSGAAIGLWQWHWKSYRYIRRQMGYPEPILDERADPIVSTETALWALTHGYEDWWTVAAACRKELQWDHRTYSTHP